MTKILRHKAAAKTLGIALLVIGFFSANVNAQVYKWVDENGQIHYSDKKPIQQKDVSTVKIRTHSSNNTKSSSPAPNTPEKEAQLKAKAEKLAQPKTTAATSEKDYSKECETIRINLQKIQNTTRLRINDGGQMRYLSPEEIEEKKSNYLEMLESHC